MQDTCWSSSDKALCQGGIASRAMEIRPMTLTTCNPSAAREAALQPHLASPALHSAHREQPDRGRPQKYALNQVLARHKTFVGCTQPVQIRLHRLAFLASCGDLEATSGLQIRHICGNKACAMVSHFRAGTTTANSADREYHKSRKGRSRESFPPLQQ